MTPLKKHRFWANIIGFAFIIAFIAIAVRIGRIQLIEHDEFTKRARIQQYKKVSLPARRGMILDRNGSTLAESLQVGSIYANPAEIDDVNYTTRPLNKILKLNSSKISKLNNKNKRFVWLKRKVQRRRA